MADRAFERMTIAASPEACFAVATEFEKYPEWAADVKEAVVAERDDQDRGTLVTYRVAAMGRSARYTLRYDYSAAPGELSWVLEAGDIMRKLDGHYLFTPDDHGTDVTYELDVELIVPIPGFVKRRAEGTIIGTALRELKKRVESG
jgi:ribosome-associated toxin RatA of RatAB toxin-antitoxin module